MSEANMGRRRAITRADEDEVRRRVARAPGERSYRVTVYGERIAIDGWQGVEPPWDIAADLATVGIFRGVSGWEIECAPAVSDAPPVDREQAIRDALLAAFAALHTAREVDLLLHALNGAQWADPKPALPDVRTALASIGAERDGDRWRLSDGPPRGWEWEKRGGVTVLHARGEIPIARVYGRGDWYIDKPGVAGCVAVGTDEVEQEKAKSAALLACRRAGLFAPVASSPAEPPRLDRAEADGPRLRDEPRDPAHEATIADLEAQIVGLVARLATVTMAHKPPGATCADCDTLSERLRAAEIRASEADADRLAAENERDETAREVASWKDEHGRMHSDRDRQRRRITDLMDQLWATKAERDAEKARANKARDEALIWMGRADQAGRERDAARKNEADAGHRIAQMEKALAQVTAERNEARLNVVDARAHCASWKARAEDAEGKVAAMRTVLNSDKAAS